MKINTSKGGEFDTDLAFVIASDQTLMIRLLDDHRPLPQIALDFDGLEWIRTEDGREFNGFTVLCAVVRFDAHETQIRLRREGFDDT